MNRKNLNLIIDNYISRFEELTAPDGSNENYKWYAVHDFQEIFDLDAPDFAVMLNKAWEATENLIDNYVQPFKSLVVMAEKNGEADSKLGSGLRGIEHHVRRAAARIACRTKRIKDRWGSYRPHLSLTSVVPDDIQ